MIQNAHDFRQGDESIEQICFPDGAVIEIGCHVDAISVSMEYGQSACVPWFAVWKDGKVVSKWNAAHVEGVVMKGGRR